TVPAESEAELPPLPPTAAGADTVVPPAPASVPAVTAPDCAARNDLVTVFPPPTCAAPTESAAVLPPPPVPAVAAAAPADPRPDRAGRVVVGQRGPRRAECDRRERGERD